MALMTLRTLTADLGCGPMNTVSRDHPDFRKLQRKKDPATMLYLELREHIAHDIKVAGVEASGCSRTYAKLDKLYPKNDERSPDFKKHKVKVNALAKKNESSMLDLFKATKEVITITPELRAHVTKKVRDDEAAAEAEEAAAKAAEEAAAKAAAKAAEAAAKAAAEAAAKAAAEAAEARAEEPVIKQSQPALRVDVA
jgi:hypothetical protein